MNRNFWLKLKESLCSVAPIIGIVLILHFTIAPMSAAMCGFFVIGAFLLILGMGFFTLGADVAMVPMGEAIGAQLTRSRKLWLLVIVAFVMGVAVTIAEPDLEVLAQQVPGIPNETLILTISIGVGVFLVIAFLRILFRVPLAYMLIGFYALLAALAFFTPQEFLSVAFDSGGVTTGPITVPFIMALGIGIAAVRGGKDADDDSFGLIALCSIGPIMTVLLLGMFFDLGGAGYEQAVFSDLDSFGAILAAFGSGLLVISREVAIALAPIVAAFAIFQIFALKLPRTVVLRMAVGILFTYIGLVLFLGGVKIGFMPIGNYLGGAIASLPYRWVLVPLAVVMGCFVVAAEPAIHVLKKQVEEVSAGTISQRALLLSLAIGVGISLGIAMLRVLFGLHIGIVLIVGYSIALALTFFVPKIFTAIAFDSGGVASGPMTATFLLPFAVGACAALGGNIMTDAFGLVAMVAMTPLITVQILGLIYATKQKQIARHEAELAIEGPEDEEVIWDDDDDVNEETTAAPETAEAEAGEEQVRPAAPAQEGGESNGTIPQ